LKKDGQSGVLVAFAVFASFGGWKGVLMKRGHPKSEEIQAAGEWAKNWLKA